MCSLVQMACQAVSILLRSTSSTAWFNALLALSGVTRLAVLAVRATLFTDVERFRQCESSLVSEAREALLAREPGEHRLAVASWVRTRVSKPPECVPSKLTLPLSDLMGSWDRAPKRSSLGPTVTSSSEMGGCCAPLSLRRDCCPGELTFAAADKRRLAPADGLPPRRGLEAPPMRGLEAPLTRGVATPPLRGLAVPGLCGLEALPLWQSGLRGLAAPPRRTLEAPPATGLEAPPSELRAWGLYVLHAAPRGAAFFAGLRPQACMASDRCRSRIVSFWGCAGGAEPLRATALGKCCRPPAKVMSASRPHMGRPCRASILLRTGGGTTVNFWRPPWTARSAPRPVMGSPCRTSARLLPS
mmetsp:Transcript_91796/g.273923  ORF Transcript_91796/g.273923 Transcript_91796/m.273923 type:complete len:358 (+) Transcript_91796:274-1347(+)